MKSIFLLLLFLGFSISIFSQIKIYTTNGNVIECQSVEKKRFGVDYIPVNSTDNYGEYIANTKIDRIEYADGEIEYVSGTPDKQTNRRNPKDFTYLSLNYVSLNVGPAIPYSVFATDPGPYSMVGINTEIDASFYPFGGGSSATFLGGIGIGIVTGYSYNPFDGTQHQAFVSNALMADTAANITNLNVRTGGWNNFYFLGGLGYNGDLGRVMLDYKLLLGFHHSSYPRADASYANNGVAQTSVFTASSFNYMLGLYGSIRYFLTRKFSLKANVSFLFSGSGFDELNRKDYVGDQLIGEYSTNPFTSTTFLNFNVTFGVAYTIGR